MQVKTIKTQFAMANLSLNISVAMYEEKRVRIFHKKF